MTESVTLYGLTKCSTCQKAQAWLREHNIAYRFVDYRDNPVAPDVLRQWADAVGGWEKLVNRASMTWRNLPEADKAPQSPQQWLDLIAAWPALVRRPVTVRGDRVRVGFTDKAYTEFFA